MTCENCVLWRSLNFFEGNAVILDAASIALSWQESGKTRTVRGDGVFECKLEECVILALKNHTDRCTCHYRLRSLNVSHLCPSEVIIVLEWCQGQKVTVWLRFVFLSRRDYFLFVCFTFSLLQHIPSAQNLIKKQEKTIKKLWAKHKTCFREEHFFKKYINVFGYKFIWFLASCSCLNAITDVTTRGQ